MKTKLQKMSMGTGYKDDEKAHKPLPIKVSVMAVWTKPKSDYIDQCGILYSSACTF